VKVSELLLEHKRDASNRRRDYVLWKRLVNIDTKQLKLLVDEREGLTTKELKGVKIRRGPNRATIRMRSKPFAEWSSEDLNWMYRQLAYITRTLKIDEPLMKVTKDGKKPTDKLVSLITWGHRPGGVKFTFTDGEIVLK
jgi:hypothetical protein